MKQPGTDPDDVRLDALLRSWDLDATLPPCFADGVWRRLAERPQRGVQVLASGLADRLATRLRRPRFALAYLFLVLFAGAGTGAWQGREGSSAIEDGLRGRYVLSIDPYAADRR